MSIFHCDNCRNDFSAGGASFCPRCNSKRITERKERKTSETTSVPAGTHKPHVSRGPMIVGDTKSSWASFHSNEVRACSDCGGNEFDFNWKHGEKVCKKCGAVYSVRRNR